jgi:Na+/proline symporter
MSTIDSVLLVAAGALQRDIMPLMRKSKSDASLPGARAIVLICALLSLVLASLSRAFPEAGLGIVELTVFAGALYAGAFLPGLIGILYWPGSTAAGAIMGMVAGVLSTALWKFGAVALYPSLVAVPEVFVGILFGTAAFIFGSLYSPLRNRN